MLFKDLELGDHFTTSSNNKTLIKVKYVKGSCCKKEHNAVSVKNKKQSFFLIDDNEEVTLME